MKRSADALEPRAHTVKVERTGMPVDRVAMDLGVSSDVVRRWVEEAGMALEQERKETVYDFDRQMADHLEATLDTLTAQA